MKKLIVGAALGLLTVGVGSTAFAGEIGGNGEETPVKTRHVAGSECAFSGLEDGEEGEQPFAPGNTQNWGQIPKEVRDQIAAFASPGIACRGFASQRG